MAVYTRVARLCTLSPILRLLTFNTFFNYCKSPKNLATTGLGFLLDIFSQTHLVTLVVNTHNIVNNAVAL
jgi:hypothetical protein